MSSDPIITIADMRPFFCVKGIKKGFDEAGVDFTHFLQHGARASDLKGHGFDAAIDRIVEGINERKP